MPSPQPRERSDAGRPRIIEALGWAAAAVGMASLGILAAHATQIPLPYPGALLLLAAVLAAYAGGLGAGVLATLLTMLLTASASVPALEWLPHGPRATAMLAVSQLVATTLVGLMKGRMEVAVRRQLQAEADARDAAAVFHAEQALRLVVDNIPQRVFWKDTDGRYLGCNTQFARDAGFASSREVIGKTDFDMAWKADAEAYRVDDAAVIAGLGAKIGYEEPQHRPDGSALWLRTSKVPMLGADGAIVGVLGTYEDTTEQRKREEQLRIASNVHEFALDAVMTLDLQHRIVSVNQAFTTITGYPREEVLGRDQAFLRSDRHPQELYDRIWDVTDKTGRWQGELWRRHRDGMPQLVQASISVVRDDAGMPTHYVMVFSDITRSRADAERAAYLAYHDPLTGLANRIAFLDAIRRALARSAREHTCVAVLYIDLDGFKPVNDSLGHAAGDELLKQVGARLSDAVRKADVVARLGGDEFAVLLDEVGGSAECVALGEKLLALLARAYSLSGYELFLSASIGISLASDGDTDGETLLKNADVAMYEAKRTGKGRYHVFSHNLDAQARRTLALTNQLHLALERDELALAYQPKIAIRDGRIVAFEALMRWTSTQLGVVSPADFIPVAEHTGLIDRIGDWALLAACRQARQWTREMPDLAICVNVSARQLRSAGFARRLEDILRETGLEAGRLELEITESVIITEPEQTIDMLLRIRDMGVGLVLDDFGTGYSSLSYLQRLPVNCIKIDRSFVKDLPDNSGDASLIRAILGLADTLALGVVAEGVETRDQLAFLGGLGCKLAQGYLFSRPVPAEAATALLGTSWSTQSGAFGRCAFGDMAAR
jgi:diguanylate cyclase (GGDEF)-like protein/PAS domain S-box-containing protein